MAKKNKINLPKTGSEVGLLIIRVIKEIFRQIDKYGPEVIKLIARVLSFLGKWGTTGILSLRTYLDEEEKKLTAVAGKKKTAKTKKAKRKPAKKKEEPEDVK
ncbi:MAG: hypothetical protein PHY02_05035 [Phycisphaerae bacterium]|nr:hypothetical protein [Phycisphaerae bacterium]